MISVNIHNVSRAYVSTIRGSCGGAPIHVLKIETGGDDVTLFLEGHISQTDAITIAEILSKQPEAKAAA